MTTFLLFLKSVFSWILRNPTFVLCIIVASVVGWLYLNNVRLEDIVDDQTQKIERLSDRIDQYKNLVDGIEASLKEKDDAQKKLEEVLKNQSKEIASLRVRLDPKALQKILETQGKQALEDYLNTELQKRLKCLEGGCDG